MGSLYWKLLHTCATFALPFLFPYQGSPSVTCICLPPFQCPSLSFLFSVCLIKRLIRQERTFSSSRIQVSSACFQVRACFYSMLRFTNVDKTPTRLPPVYAFYNHPLLPLREALAPILSRIPGLDRFIPIAINECHFPSEHGLTRDESASIYIYTMHW